MVDTRKPQNACASHFCSFITLSILVGQLTPQNDTCYDCAGKNIQDEAPNMQITAFIEAEPGNRIYTLNVLLHVRIAMEFSSDPYAAPSPSSMVAGLFRPCNRPEALSPAATQHALLTISRSKPRFACAVFYTLFHQSLSPAQFWGGERGTTASTCLFMRSACRGELMRHSRYRCCSPP